MIFVIVRVEDVLHRLVCDFFDLRRECLEHRTSGIFGIDQDDAFAGDVHSNIAAATFDLVKIALDSVHRHLWGLVILVLRGIAADPRDRKKQDAGRNPQQYSASDHSFPHPSSGG